MTYVDYVLAAWGIAGLILLWMGMMSWWQLQQAWRNAEEVMDDEPCT